jgi:hypothetical protein
MPFRKRETYGGELAFRREHSSKETKLVLAFLPTARTHASFAEAARAGSLSVATLQAPKAK